MKTYTLEQFKKFAKEIEAYENGEEVEIWNSNRKEWIYNEIQNFFPSMEYRIKPKLTREEITDKWVKENDLKIGDKVKVLKGFEYEPFGIIKGHSDKCIGKTFVVDSIGRIGIGFDCDTRGWYFPVECLEKVKEEYVPFKVEDWDSIKDKWVKCGKELTDTISIQRINGINLDSENILIGNTWTLLKCAFSEYIFEDGTPFGKLKL